MTGISVTQPVWHMGATLTNMTVGAVGAVEAVEAVTHQIRGKGSEGAGEKKDFEGFWGILIVGIEAFDVPESVPDHYHEMMHCFFVTQQIIASLSPAYSSELMFASESLL
jgi:hypothetical protein